MTLVDLTAIAAREPEPIEFVEPCDGDEYQHFVLLTVQERDAVVAEAMAHRDYRCSAYAWDA